MSAPSSNLGVIQLPQLIVDSVAYNFTVRLDLETSNVVSTLTVGNVMANLNETVINCTEPASVRSEMLIVSIPANDQQGIL